jgi:hypothetical protein
MGKPLKTFEGVPQEQESPGEVFTWPWQVPPLRFTLSRTRRKLELRRPKFLSRTRSAPASS